ncbi:MAG TPA: alpha/beta hydrolase [Casimicrobiaceae bacterium]|jgi:pimeloyl-ACP methyl ester carboxylesterase
MATLARGDVDLYYECHGDGAPLLLITGLASDSQSWQPVIADLASRYRVIVVDNRGAGRTTPQDAPTSIRTMTDDCVALIEHLRLPSVHVLGHSMGGFVAQDFAIRYPDNVGALMLVATSSVNSNRNNDLFADWASALAGGADMKTWFRTLFYWIFSTRFFDDDAVVEQAIQYALAYRYPQSAVAFQNQIGAIAAFDSTETLSHIRSQTLVIGGAEDLLFPIEVCRTFSRAIPSAAFETVENAAHSVHMENPQAFVEQVFEFLPQR